MRDSKTTRFTKRIGITKKDLSWINNNKRKKSAAGFLEEIIKYYEQKDKSTTSRVNFWPIENQ